VVEIVTGNGGPVVLDYVDPDVPLTWEKVKQVFNLSLVQAQPPEGAKVWRLTKLVYRVGPMAFRVYCEDENGARKAGIIPFVGWEDGRELPANMAPRIGPNNTWAQPGGKPNKALLHADNNANVTGQDGWIEHIFGPGQQYNYGAGIQGPHWEWVSDSSPDGAYTDVLLGTGWWNEHEMFWPVFTLMNAGAGPEPPEPPGPEPPEDPDLAAILAELQQINATLDALVDFLRNHLPEIKAVGRSMLDLSEFFRRGLALRGRIDVWQEGQDPNEG
jgi:hypothetical protein